MGEQNVPTDSSNKERHHAFVRALLGDVQALERMMHEGLIEEGVRRIGAEQEIFLVDPGGEPASKALEVLEAIDDPAFTTELASFNLEANLPPYEFTGGCLRQLETDLERLIDKARHGAHASGAEVFLTGILPTLQITDLGLDNMTPRARYMALNNAIRGSRGGDFHVLIKGTDELFAAHDNVMLESCNTSFQIHFQVGVDEFPRLYNLAQAITGPILAAAVNSPLLLERRLWHETRVALFQHSIDDRSRAHQMRGQTPRVSFGDHWTKDVLDIFRDDIARFRVVIAAEVENSLELLDRGEIPKLRALCLHNGTVYRWNRPCYGVNDGKAHLRIENRVLPAGPTIADEVANAALYFGLMTAMADGIEDITRVMAFEDAKANFFSAARYGLNAQLTWIDGKEIAAQKLLLDDLIPLASAGLKKRGIDGNDVERCLGTLEERVKTGMTGSRWMLRSFANMTKATTAYDRCRIVTSAALARQRLGKPVHTWTLAQPEEAPDWRGSYQTVGQFMTRHLFTCQPDDPVMLSAHQMATKRIRHIPVEDGDGHLVGLVTYRSLIRLLAEGRQTSVPPLTVAEVMIHDPITVPPETPTLDAIALMRQHHIGCLPVVQNGRLIGILTERDLVELSGTLFEDHLKDRPLT
jgi:CBS domain-containing protein/gamma-glutamyl:cysteine ligase YbdK (ATP-grasp superfamily)